MGDRKAISLKIHFFNVLTSPLKNKFSEKFKYDSKTFHTAVQYKKSINVLIEVLWEMTIQIFKIVWENLA
jgi:hypothetical protein